MNNLDFSNFRMISGKHKCSVWIFKLENYIKKPQMINLDFQT